MYGEVLDPKIIAHSVGITACSITDSQGYLPCVGMPIHEAKIVEILLNIMREGKAVEVKN